MMEVIRTNKTQYNILFDILLRWINRDSEDVTLIIDNH